MATTAFAAGLRPGAWIAIAALVVAGAAMAQNWNFVLLKFQDVSRSTMQLPVVRADGPADADTRRTIHIPLSPPWMKAAAPAYPVILTAQRPGESPFSYTPLMNVTTRNPAESTTPAAPWTPADDARSRHRSRNKAASDL